MATRTYAPAPLELRGSRIRGSLIQEGRPARRRREVFSPLSVKWPAGGIDILALHRGEPEVRGVIPERMPDGRIVVEADATPGIRQAYADGRRHFSVEFRPIETRRTMGGIREVESALVEAAAMVHSPEYAQTDLELRRFGLAFGTTVPTGRRASCKCADGEASQVEFGADAFQSVEGLDVTAILRGADSVIASTATDSLILRRTAGGALGIGLTPLATEAGRRTRELLDAGQPVYARPVWTTDESEFEVVDGVAVVSRAWFSYILVRPVPASDAQGLNALGRASEGRSLSLSRRRMLALA